MIAVTHHCIMKEKHICTLDTDVHLFLNERCCVWDVKMDGVVHRHKTDIVSRTLQRVVVTKAFIHSGVSHQQWSWRLSESTSVITHGGWLIHSGCRYRSLSWNLCWETLREATTFSLSSGEDEERGRGSPLLPPNQEEIKKSLLARPWVLIFDILLNFLSISCYLVSLATLSHMGGVSTHSYTHTMARKF